MNTYPIAEVQKRRDKTEIMAEIIEISRKGALKTQIMYKANLSFSQLNEYLRLLLQLNFLEKPERNQNGKKVYKATAKGQEFLDRQKDVVGLINEAYSIKTGMRNFGLNPLSSIRNEKS